MIEKVWDNLYTLDSKGKVRIFTCKVVRPIGDTRFDGIHYEGYTIVTETGLLGGKLIEKKEVVKKGKQGRDILAQAFFQADSLWRSKNDEGYKSFNQLRNKSVIREGVPDYVEKIQDIWELLYSLPHASYTNSNWDELPMLAHKYKDQKKNIKFPVYIQPKYNGVRCLVKAKGAQVILISRGGTYYQIPHLQEQLYNLLFSIKKSLILDGELYKHGVNLQDISGAARTEEETLLITSNGWLEYHIYDVVDLNKPNQTQIEREETRNAIRLLANGPYYSHIKFVKSNIALDHEEIKENHDDYIGMGYEGAIVRLFDAKYEFNQRSRGLIKVKEFLDEEFEIIGCETDPNGSVAESFVFKLRNNIDNNTFLARPTGSLTDKLIWHNQIDQFIGKKATVRFQERSKDGLPIQGHVRSDLTEVLHIRPDTE